MGVAALAPTVARVGCGAEVPAAHPVRTLGAPREHPGSTRLVWACVCVGVCAGACVCVCVTACVCASVCV